MTRPSGARWSSVGGSPPSRRGPWPRTPRRAGWRRSRRGRTRRKVAGLRADDVAQEASRGPASPRWSSSPGRRHLDRVVAEVGQRAGRAAAGRRWRAGWRSSAGLAARGEVGQLRTGPAFCVEQLVGPVASAATPRAGPGARGCCGRRTSGTWWERKCPRRAGRRPPSGPSSPWACGGRSSARRARSVAPARRARAWIVRDLVERPVHAPRPSAGARSPVVALDEDRAGSRSPRTALISSVVAGSGRGPSGWRSCSR